MDFDIFYCTFGAFKDTPEGKHWMGTLLDL